MYYTRNGKMTANFSTWEEGGKSVIFVQHFSSNSLK